MHGFIKQQKQDLTLFLQGKDGGKLSGRNGLQWLQKALDLDRLGRRENLIQAGTAQIGISGGTPAANRNPEPFSQMLDLTVRVSYQCFEIKLIVFLPAKMVSAVSDRDLKLMAQGVGRADGVAVFK